MSVWFRRKHYQLRIIGNHSARCDLFIYIYIYIRIKIDKESNWAHQHISVHVSPSVCCIWALKRVLNRLSVTDIYSRPCNRKEIKFKEMLINSKVHRLPAVTWVQSHLYQVLFHGQSYNQLILAQIYIQNIEYFDPTIFERSKIHTYHCT